MGDLCYLGIILQCMYGIVSVVFGVIGYRYLDQPHSALNRALHFQHLELQLRDSLGVLFKLVKMEPGGLRIFNLPICHGLLIDS